MEGKRSKITLHLLDVVFAQELQVLDRGILLVVNGYGAHLIELLIKVAYLLTEIFRRGLTRSNSLLDLLLQSPNLINSGFNRPDKLHVHLLLVVQEPRSFLGLRHIRQYHYGVIEGVLAKVGLDTAISRKGFLFQLFIIYELGFVDQEPRERKRVGRAGAVLRNNDSARAVIEGNNVLEIGRLDDGRAKGLGRLLAYDIVDVRQQAPSTPSGEEARNGVRQTMLERGYDDTAC